MEMEDALVSFIFKLSFFSLLSEKFGGNEEEEEAQERDFRRKEVKGRLKRGKLIILVWFLVILNTQSAFSELKKYKIKGKVISLI